MFTFNSRLRTCENTSSHFCTKPCGIEVWGLEWIRSPIPLIREQLAALQSDNEPNHLRQALDVSLHSSMTWQETEPLKHIRVQRFSRPPVHLLYWHAVQLCLFQRNLWFLLCICWEVSFAVFGFWNNASVTCCFWAHITWLGGSISATQSFDYSKWVHYCISRSHKGSDCLATSLCLSSFSR